VCTHLGCITRFQPDLNIIACPCHGSKFNLSGDVLHGPAPRPLHWLQISLSDKGNLIVDTAVEVPEGTVYRV
jgi:cytochrome b6-f complex iron-sulfur subunit